MNTQEKNLLRIFMVMVMAVLVVRVLPAFFDLYQKEKTELADLHDKRKRLERLLERADFWQAKYQQSKQQEKTFQNSLFTGETQELVSARVQSVLKNIIRETQIKEESMSLPEFFKANGWLLVKQTMTFKTDPNALMNFLSNLKKVQPELHVISLSINANRDLLSGTITVAGLSRT